MTNLIRRASLPSSVVQWWWYPDCGSVGSGTAKDVPEAARYGEKNGTSNTTTLRTSRQQRFPQRQSPPPARNIYEADLEVEQELETLPEEDDVIPKESARKWLRVGSARYRSRAKQKTAGKGRGSWGQTTIRAVHRQSSPPARQKMRMTVTLFSIGIDVAQRRNISRSSQHRSVGKLKVH